MFDTLSRSWSLVKASAAVLRADKELLWFPVISSLAAFVVAASFFVPSLLGGLFDGGMGPASFAVGFLFYLCQYFVIFFFNSALVGAAMIRLQGGDPTVADGLRIARSRAGAILGYAAIAAVVGLLLRLLERRSRWLGSLMTRLLGAAWTVSTFLVVPVLVARDIGPVEAIKESVALLRRSWGENLVGTVGFGLVFGLLTFAAVLVGVALVVFAAVAVGAGTAVTVAVLAVVAILVLTATQAALSGIYQAALYRYAVDGHAPEGFNGVALGNVFRAK